MIRQMTSQIISMRKKTLLPIALLAGLFTLSGPVSADITSEDTQKIEQIIENYIAENPEILARALTRYAQAEAEAAERAAMMLVQEDAGDPYIGAKKPDLIIYEFSDYNCGYCKRVFEDIIKIVDEDDALRLTIKEFPILADSSVLAARAGIAAHKQMKFSEFHREMMRWRGRIDAQSIDQIAQKIGLDRQKLQTDMVAPETDNILERTRQIASALELRGTPALVIGNTLIPGAISRDEILDLIKQARADKTDNQN